jgi:hypothetical protein
MAVRVCYSGWFIIGTLWWALSIATGALYFTKFCELGLLPSSGNGLSLYWLFYVSDNGWDRAQDLLNAGLVR